MGMSIKVFGKIFTGKMTPVNLCQVHQAGEPSEPEEEQYKVTYRSMKRTHQEAEGEIMDKRGKGEEKRKAQGIEKSFDGSSRNLAMGNHCKYFFPTAIFLARNIINRYICPKLKYVIHVLNNTPL